MHFVNHNFTDIDFETKHMSRIEKTIYFDLRSIYLSSEKPIDGSDMELLQRRLSVIDDTEKQAFAFVLKDKFDKAGKLFKQPAWDKIIKDYKFQQISAALSDMTKRLRADGVTIEANAGMSAIRELYIQRFGGDKLTRITNKANVMTNEANVKANVMTNEDEYKLTSNDERKFMVDSLKGMGESVTLKTSISTLRELYTKRFNSDSKVDATNAIRQANDMTNTSANPMTNEANDKANEINAENDTITINQEPRTINHKPSEREAHTNTGEGTVDNFATDAVDNSADNFTATTQPTATNPVSTETQLPVNQPATKAEQVRSQNADDIENWEAPTIDEMRGELFRAGKLIQLNDDQYQFELLAFKAHYAEQALKGNPLTTDSYRKVKLIKWMMREADNQKANHARQEKAKGTFNIDNEDWSGTTANRPTQSNGDIPDVFHPSHSTGNTDTSQPLFLNGLKREPFAGMTTDESYALVDKHTQIGEARVAAYDRLLSEMRGIA